MKNIFNILFLLTACTVFAQVDRSMPSPGPAPKINLKEAKQFTLKNGLTVLVVENHKLPRATVSLSMDMIPIKEGSISGVQSLTGDLVGNGTTSISKDDFNERIDYLGARLSINTTSAYGTSLSKYFPTLMELMADGIMNPLFTQEELDKKKEQLIEGLKSDKKSVSAVASRVENNLLYGDNHAYGEFISEETVANVSLTDVKTFYNTYNSPENAYMVIVGDVSYKKVKKLVSKLFKGWEKSSNVLKDTSINPSELNATEIDFVNMSNAVQSEVSVVNPVYLNMSDKDYLAALLANKILGGGGEARLFLNLREDKAYTYGAYSSLGSGKYVSKFRAGASVRNEVTDSAVVALMYELKRIRTEMVSDEELANAKAAYTGRFVMNVEKPSTVANFAVNKEIYNLSDDFYATYLERLNAVTKEDILRVSKKYFKENNARILIVGKATEVLENVEKLPYPIKYYDAYGEATDKPKSKTIDPSVTVESVLNSYFVAIGGKDKASKVTSLMTSSEAEVQGTKIEVMMKMMAPNKMKQETSMMGQVMQKIVFDGTAGYAEGRGQKSPLDADKIEALKSTSLPFIELNLIESGTLDGIETINGSDAYGIKTASGDVHYYDVASGLKVRTSTKSKGPDGSDVVQNVDLSNYKEVSGIKFPHTSSMKMGPMDIEINTTKVLIDSQVSSEDFK